MIKYRISLPIILLVSGLLFFSCGVYSQKTALDKCDGFKKFAIQKKERLLREVDRFPAPKFTTKQALIQVVYPEYITYDTSKDKLERACIQLFENLGMERYKTISFGPFQMQLQFIKEVVKHTPENEISHPTLLVCKRGDYEEMIGKLESLSEIRVQWEILLHYEQYFKTITKSDNSVNLDQMINRYNSGKLDPVKTAFKKINCNQLSYLQWSKLIDSW